jgi:hypothetical protein
MEASILLPLVIDANADANPGDTTRYQGRLVIRSELTKLAHLRQLSDAAVLGGSCNSQLVMRLGQRFESARRLSGIGIDKPNSPSSTRHPAYA